MIHRKWSLMTGPAVVMGGIIGTVLVANFVIFQNVSFIELCSTFNSARSRFNWMDPFGKTRQTKPDKQESNK